MTQQLWSAVDEYAADLLIESDPVFEEALAASAAAGLPEIAVSPSQGKLLHLLARMHGSRSILELGTLGAYSTIWLARALPPGGRMVTLEVDPAFARVAAANLERASLSDRVELRVGRASDSLHELRDEPADPFDFIFIDADKQSTPEYFAVALELTRPGSVILTDNVVRAGALADGDSDDPRVTGMRRFHEMLSCESRVSATTIQTVGSKGYDGFTLAIVENEQP
jgi:predicted O-methyltransferase YrrM